MGAPVTAASPHAMRTPRAAPEGTGRGLPGVRAVLSFVSFWTALAAVVLAPVPFGSVEGFWIASWCGLLGFSLLTAAGSRPTRDAVRLIAAASVLMSLVLAASVLQSMPDPPFGADPIWREASAWLQQALTPRMAPTAQAPWLLIGPSLLATLTAIRFGLIGSDPDRARLAMTVIGIAGVVIGIATLVGFAVDPTHLLGRPKVFYPGTFTGTFVNRNTAATYFGTCAIIWTSRFVDALAADRHAHRSTRLLDRLLLVLDLFTGRTILVGAAALVSIGCTVITASRAGFILTLLCCGITVALHVFRRGFDGRSKLQSALAIAGALAALFLLIGDPVSTRIGSNGLVDRYRLEVYRLCLHLIATHPLLGIGLGNFEAIFPSVRSPDLGMFGVWERAHSTPLELAVELGLPIFAAVAAVWLWAFSGLLRRTRRTTHRGPTIIALAVLALGTLHSSVDFSLQIPGYAIVFVALVSIGLTAPPQPEQEEI